MATVWIDGKPYDVDPTRNMLDVALSLGYDLPYFCWHPAMGSVGACRQCAVKQFRDANDTRGRIVMACMTPAADGTRIAIADPEARAFRKSVIEWLMVNHPHDCPVCDEGGECHLQDMTVQSGHVYRRFRFRKRTFRNQDLGPLVNHEMNRCITCYRCVRYYRDYAGGHDLHERGAHDHVYFGRATDGVLESPFAGNLVEVCPTGVFTDKTQKQHYVRNWDLDNAPSVCVHCSLGCNTLPGARAGIVRRVRNRYNEAVNGFFLCDRGRYGYDYVNTEARLRLPLAPRGAEEPAEALSRDEALARAAAALASGGPLFGIGSPRASVEANFALRELVGPDHFFQGISHAEHRLTTLALEILQRGPVPSASLREVERADAVLLLGEPVGGTAPMLELMLRQTARTAPRRAEALRAKIPGWQDASVRELLQNDKGPLFVASSIHTGLEHEARQALRLLPEEIARLGFAIAGILDATAPSPGQLPVDRRLLAESIARALAEAERPVIVSGTSAGSEAVLHATANVAWALAKNRGDNAARLFLAVPECNSLGLALLGGGSLDDARTALAEADGRHATVIVLENDLYRRLPAARADELLASLQHLIVLDQIAHATAARAELLLPTTSFADGHGTLVNNEGRAQRFFAIQPCAAAIQDSWRWLRDIAIAARHPRAEQLSPWTRIEELQARLAATLPALAHLRQAAPDDLHVADMKIARASHRQSGRTAILANISVHEPKPPTDPDSSLSFSMEGFGGPLPDAVATQGRTPGWNSPQALFRFRGESAGPLRHTAAGARLVEPDASGPRSYFAATLAPVEVAAEAWRLIPIAHVFGSEELSTRAPAIEALAPAPYLLLAEVDARALGVEPGASLLVDLDGHRHRLPVRIAAELPRGCVGIPKGLDALPGPLPDAVRIEKP